MVSKILKLLNREVGAVNQAALLLGLFTLLSQVFGLIRDRMFTSNIGAGKELDIYYAAFQAPDLLFNSVATLVSVTVLLPFLLSIVREKGAKESLDFFSQVFTVFFVIIIIIAIIAFFLLPKLTSVIAPGFDASQQFELVRISRIILLSPILLGISNLFGSVTQMTKRFVLFAVSPVLYNLGIVIGIAFLYPIFGLIGLAYGVVFGALLHVVIQVPALIKDNMLPKFTRSIDWKRIRALSTMSLPRTLGLTLHSLTLIVLVAFATTIKDGAVSIFRLSMNLQNVPLALIGASFSVAAFPTLAQDFTNGKTKEFLQNISNAMRQIIFWSLPITALFIVLRAQIVRVILGSQTFTWEDTRLAAATLAMFVFSVTAQSLILLFTRAFYATGDTKRPVVINLVSSFIIVGLSFFLFSFAQNLVSIESGLRTFLRLTDVSGVKVTALALAYSLGSILNACVLVYSFKKRHKTQKELHVSKMLIQTILVSFVMGVVAYGVLNISDTFFNLNTFLGIFSQGLLAGVVAILMGIGMFYLVGNKEFESVKKALQRKFKGVETVSVAHEDIG